MHIESDSGNLTRLFYYLRKFSLVPFFSMFNEYVESEYLDQQDEDIHYTVCWQYYDFPLLR